MTLKSYIKNVGIETIKQKITQGFAFISSKFWQNQRPTGHSHANSKHLSQELYYS